MNRGRGISLFWLALYLLTPLIVICLPLRVVETGPSLCLVKHIIGRPCPGCGMTRAAFAAAHGQFQLAWHYNHMVVIVLPLLGWVWLRNIIDEFRKIRPTFPLPRV
jgi:hypothetical protein